MDTVLSEEALAEYEALTSSEEKLAFISGVQAGLKSAMETYNNSRKEFLTKTNVNI